MPSYLHLKWILPVIVFGAFALINSLAYGLFTAVFVEIFNEHGRLFSTDYGIPIMILGALAFLVSGCIYRTKDKKHKIK